MAATVGDELKYFFKSKSVLSILMLINIAVFILVNLTMLFSRSFGELLIQNMAVPAYPQFLAEKPWTMLTYMFLQFDFFHIFFNMYMLYLGGKLFINYLGSKKLISTYITGGFFGAIFFIAAFNIFPVFIPTSPLSISLGASASVLAVFVAIATYKPNYTFNLLFIGQVKLKHIALIFIVIDILSISHSNPGGHIAHLGGAFWGFIYIIGLRNNIFPLSKLGKAFSNIKFSGKTTKPKFKVHNKGQRPVSDDVYNKQRAESQKKIDAILDKISKYGYESLSKEEKDILFNMSKK